MRALEKHELPEKNMKKTKTMLCGNWKCFLFLSLVITIVLSVDVIGFNMQMSLSQMESVKIFS